MELKVFWTEIAVEQLENIFDYYKYKASIKVSQRIVNKIIERTIQLKKQPLSGQIEELLVNRKNEYRYVIEEKYKIIYWIEDNYIKVASVFDTRQNPVKLKEI
jgi:plasmid stabilization system protein ParE